MASKMTKYTVGAVALLLAASACDTDVEGEVVHLRDGDGGNGTWGTGKLNTNFLGEDGTYPLNAIPLVDDPKADVRLHAVWSDTCISTGGEIEGLFYTSALNGDLGISVVDGKLQPATFRKWGDDTVECTVEGALWVNTVWGIMTPHEEDPDKTANHYMMLLDQGMDLLGEPTYKWGFFTGAQPEPFNPKLYKPTCAEDLAPLGSEAYAFRFHSYLIDGLEVDEATGDFSYGSDSVSVACTSGAIGKSISWGYTPWVWGEDVHELGTRITRADYCGTGKPHTKEGNRLQLRDEFGINAYADPEYEDEAAWDLELGRATCVTMPRDHGLRQDFAGIECHIDGEAVILPSCDEGDLSAAEITTKVGD